MQVTKELCIDIILRGLAYFEFFGKRLIAKTLEAMPIEGSRGTCISQ